MTAPVKEITLTDGIYRRFAHYHKYNAAWGVFHVSLDDGNWDCAIDPDWMELDELTYDIPELIAIHNKLSPSQRKKLAAKADVRDYIYDSEAYRPLADSPQP